MFFLGRRVFFLEGGGVILESMCRVNAVVSCDFSYTEYCLERG